ncbi:MAG: tRNA-binding protein [Stackebrandtia sp.]
MTEPAPQISVDDFSAVDIRVGTVTRAEPFPKARKPAYRLWVDFGDLGIRKTSAQLTALYDHADLVGRQVLAVVNFPSRQVADFMSEVLVLGLPGQDGEVVLVQPDREVEPGLRLS